MIILVRSKYSDSISDNILCLAPILEEHDEALEDLKEEESLKLIRSITLAQIQIYEKLKLNSKIHSLASYLAENDSTRKGFYQELQKRYPL